MANKHLYPVIVRFLLDNEDEKVNEAKYEGFIKLVGGAFPWDVRWLHPLNPYVANPNHTGKVKCITWPDLLCN